MAEDGWRDISVAFRESTVPWPDDTPVSCGWNLEMAKGASVNVSRWTLSPHVGTHADAPLHVTATGAGADALPHAAFRGTAYVVDVSDLSGEITDTALDARGVPRNVERLLLKTGASVASGGFPAAWPVLATSAAEALVARGLRLLGVDAPSVDARESRTLAVHHAIFGSGAFILENLDLRNVRPGSAELLALPLLTGPVDAAPVRALLRPLG